MTIILEAIVGERLATTEAAGLLVWHLAHGDGMTNEQAAQLTGFSETGVYDMLCRLSRVVPIYEDERHVWQVLALHEMN